MHLLTCVRCSHLNYLFLIIQTADISADTVLSNLSWYKLAKSPATSFTIWVIYLTTFSCLRNTHIGIYYLSPARKKHNGHHWKYEAHHPIMEFRFHCWTHHYQLSLGVRNVSSPSVLLLRHVLCNEKFYHFQTKLSSSEALRKS